MAWILCKVDDLKEARPDIVEYREIEGIMFRAPDGKFRTFKVKFMISQYASYFRQKFPDTDWDDENLHFAIKVGDEIK